MKKIISIILLALIPSIVYASDPEPIKFSSGKIYVGGKKSERQIYFEQQGTAKAITNFKSWEDIDIILLSKDEKMLLVHHKPNKVRAFKLSIIDMQSLKIIKSITPGYSGNLFWTKNNNILHVWGCGSPCVEFKLYNKKFETLSEGSEACLKEFVDKNIIVSVPCVSACDGIFRIWSLDDGKVLVKKDFNKEHGNYYCNDVSIENEKLKVILKQDGKNNSQIHETISFMP
jgi:hypothetical protein